MVVELPLLNGFTRPRFSMYLNGKPINVLFDTGARGVIFTDIYEHLCVYKLSKLDVLRRVSGFGGNGSLSETYCGTLAISSRGRLIKYDNVEIIHAPLKSHKEYDMVIPMALLKDFDLKFYGNDKRYLVIDTKRDNKITYNPKYDNDGVVTEILCQSDTEDKVHELSMGSLLF